MPCARWSWLFRHLLSARKYTVSYRIVFCEYDLVAFVARPRSQRVAYITTSYEKWQIMSSVGRRRQLLSVEMRRRSLRRDDRDDIYRLHTPRPRGRLALTRLWRLTGRYRGAGWRTGSRADSDPLQSWRVVRTTCGLYVNADNERQEKANAMLPLCWN